MRRTGMTIDGLAKFVTNYAVLEHIYIKAASTIVLSYGFSSRMSKRLEKTARRIQLLHIHLLHDVRPVNAPMESPNHVVASMPIKFTPGVGATTDADVLTSILISGVSGYSDMLTLFESLAERMRPLPKMTIGHLSIAIELLRLVRNSMIVLQILFYERYGESRQFARSHLRHREFDRLTDRMLGDLVCAEDILISNDTHECVYELRHKLRRPGVEREQEKFKMTDWHDKIMSM